MRIRRGRWGLPLLTGITEPSPSGQAAQTGQPSINGMAPSTISFTYDPTTVRLLRRPDPTEQHAPMLDNNCNTQINVTDVSNNLLTYCTDYYDSSGRSLGTADASDNRTTIQYAVSEYALL